MFCKDFGNQDPFLLQSAGKKLMEKEASKYIIKFQEIDAPKIFQKLEDQLKAKNDKLVKLKLKY